MLTEANLPSRPGYVGGVPPTVNMPPTSYQPPTGQGASGGSPSSNVIPNSNLQSEAALRNKQILTGGENAWKTGLAGAKNSFDYTNQITQGNRSLEDFDNSQRGDIYGGSAREDKFRLQRARGINDTFTNNDYNNKTSSINQTWADLQAAAPEQMQAIYDQLLRQEREYGLQEGALTGNFQGGRTLAGSAQDFNQGMQNKQFDQGVKTDQRDFNYGVGRDQVGDTRYADKTQYDRGRDAIGDTRYKDETTYSRGQQAWQNAFAKEQYSDEKATKLWEQNFKSANFQQDMKDAAASRGLQWAGLNQRDKEFVADQAFREKSYQADQTQRGIDNANKETKTKDYSEDIDRIAKLYVTPGQYGAPSKVNNPEGLKNAIIALGMDDAETDRYLIMYGIPINE